MNAGIPIVLERDNVNDESVTLSRWFIRHGEKVESGILLAEVETSKANMEVYAPAAGYLVQDFSEGTDLPVSAAIGFISPEPPSPDRGPAVRQEEETLSTFARRSADPMLPILPSSNGDRAVANRAFAEGAPEIVAQSEYTQRISPLAAKMMETHGLTAADFSGKSIVRKRDILEFLKAPAVLPESPQQRQGPGADTRRASITQDYSRVALSKMKLREVASLSAGAAHTVPSTVTMTCFTRGLRRILESRLVCGNASAVFAYETSRLLRKYPTLNATYMEGAMLQYRQVNLGFAMDDGRGLKVAVLPNCDELSLQELETRLRELTLAYLDDKLTPDMLANATFTISDLSGLGVSSFLPLISENQGAILGIGGEQFAPGSTVGFFTLTLTFDHQLSNGRIASLFLNDLKERLSSYEQLGGNGQLGLACAHCGREATLLIRTGEHLLPSAGSGDYICSLCIAGY